MSIFKLKANGTTVSREIIAGLTTFFAMSYIIFVNPQILSEAGVPAGAAYLATIIATAIGTMIMALYANVPYAVAPGMGLNAFFTYTVVLGMGFTWQEALSMVFICGLINILITVTKIRKAIIRAIPVSLQNAISGGIGVFIAYIGLKNAGLVYFGTDNPGSLAVMNTPVIWLALIGLAITIVLLVLNIKGAILIGIIAATIIGIPMGITQIGGPSSISMGQAFRELGTTFGVIFKQEGIISLFSDPARIVTVLLTIFSFSITDTFDTIGTFVGTGRRSGIFSAEDERLMEEEPGVSSKMDKALIADSVATSIGAIFGTSNTTTYVESAAGIGAGGRTGLTSVVVTILFLLCIPFSGIASTVPGAATVPALILVGVMMAASLKEIEWGDLSVAIPCFFTTIFMGFFSSITDGIAWGFISYVLIQLAKIVAGKIRGKDYGSEKLSPVLGVSTLLFLVMYVLKVVA